MLGGLAGTSGETEARRVLWEEDWREDSREQASRWAGIGRPTGFSSTAHGTFSTMNHWRQGVSTHLSIT